ncbi:histidine phosphatase family protein [Paenibacillus sp. GD4]|uniref:histidine phosphatase family protein n=1 Tax=Paenibacillus sp. GD4 TaxID=3068890 RepID=UPI002796871D|nr:histidine phosphatase family protein [Paenibacillus sp. GD4]MDQ1908998.1 histidine phosphatase family protein [Paenibacillus sp. GD4]
MAAFYLLRHGETLWNADRNRYSGRTDIPLSPRGEQQAKESAEGLEGLGFTAVYSSPLKRTLQTAEPLAIRSRLPIQQDERLIEIDFGQWEGVAAADIRERFASGWQAWTTDPGSTAAGGTGETAAQVYARVLDFFTEKAKLHQGLNESVLVVTHDTLIRIFVAGMLEMPFRSYRRLRQNNAAVTVILTSEDGFVLKHLNHSMKPLKEK